VLPGGLSGLVSLGVEVRERAGAGGLASGEFGAESPELGTSAAGSGASLDGPALETLTQAQARIISTLAETIIPATDTAGATEAGVTEFVDLLVTGWLEDDERDWFLAGIETVDTLAQRAYGRDLADCEPGEQMAVVGALDDEVDRLRQDPAADETRHFFYDMKRFALAGYFSSQVGLATLGYRIVPGAFEGCVLLDQYGVGG